MGHNAVRALGTALAWRVVGAASRLGRLPLNLALLWLALGAAGLLFRTVQLFFIRGVQTGLVWAAKILTDPFHDVKMYARAPLHLLRGELIDPMLHVHDDDPEELLEGVDADEEETEPLKAVR